LPSVLKLVTFLLADLSETKPSTAPGSTCGICFHSLYFPGGNEMDSLPRVQFGSCQVLVRDEGTYFVWPLTDVTKAKIRDLLGAPDLKFGFNNTLEKVPPFCCHECGTEITFFDQVRVGLSGGSHTSERLIQALQEKVLVGTGAVHHVTCENGHGQIIPKGWAANFGWTYKDKE